MARLIDADVFKKNMDYVCTMGGWLEPISSAITEYVKKHIDAQTTVDAVEVIRCKDCKWVCYCDTENFETYVDCNCPDGGGVPQNEEWYCADGERKETDHE